MPFIAMDGWANIVLGTIGEPKHPIGQGVDVGVGRLSTIHLCKGGVYCICMYCRYSIMGLSAS